MFVIHICNLFYHLHYLCRFIKLYNWTLHVSSRMTSTYGKRESCVSSTTTTTILMGPHSTIVHQRGNSNGGAVQICGAPTTVPRAISPLIQNVNITININNICFFLLILIIFHFFLANRWWWKHCLTGLYIFDVNLQDYSLKIHCIL